MSTDKIKYRFKAHGHLGWRRIRHVWRRTETEPYGSQAVLGKVQIECVRPRCEEVRWVYPFELERLRLNGAVVDA